MKFTTDKILEELKRTGIVPVFYHPDVDVAKAVVESCYRGGIRVFEFTNRGKNAHAVFVALVDYIKKFPDLILGIGTIIDSSDIEKFAAAGANFIVSPVLKTEMAGLCRTYNVPWIPGCGTLTEIIAAKEAGAELIKVFPGFVLGPKFVSAALSVVPDLKLMPTGGVEPTAESLTALFNAGVYCVGMGSQLITNATLEKKQWGELEQKVAQVIAIRNELKLK
jgi:2-dehydro-3-deoxyphosphogluconate aldolase/(4S)-4-hydroxy-2-oxoglutarate aldolase